MSCYTKNDTIFEGIIKVRTDGKQVVTDGKKWCYLEDLKIVKPVGRLVEESIADSFNSVFKPIDFKNKSRTIYFTAIGQTTRYYRIHAHANGGSFDGDGNEAVWNSGLLKETTEETTIYYAMSNIPTP